MLIRFSPEKKQREPAWQAGEFFLKFFKFLRQGVANTERERLNISALPPHSASATPERPRLSRPKLDYLLLYGRVYRLHRSVTLRFPLADSCNGLTDSTEEPTLPPMRCMPRCRMSLHPRRTVPLGNACLSSSCALAARQY